MKKIIYIALFLVSSQLAAQQMPMYSQFLFHDYLINPGIVGTKDYYDARITQRNQWSGFNGMAWG